MNKPDIRFNGFEKEWEEKRLGDISESISVGIATSSSQFFTDKANGIPLIKNQNIKSGYIDSSNLEYITEEFDEANKTKRIKTGDIITVRTGYPGISSVVPKEFDNAQTFTTLITRLDLSKYNPDFICAFINSPLGERQLIGMQAGGAQKNINAGVLESFKLKIPLDNTEQEMVYNFVKNIDTLILSTQKEHEKLVALKKCMLQKMFPKKGSLVPEIRFEGFSGDWVEKKLGDFSEKVIEKNTLNFYSDVFTNSAENGIVSQRDFFDHDIANKDNVMGYYVVSPDDFIYNPRISSFAPVGPINRNKLNKVGIVSPLYYVFRIINMNKLYIEWYFKTSLWHDFMFLNGNSGARSDRLSIKDNAFAKLPILVPVDENEQQKIGSYFQNLDNLISKQSAELEKLKNVKKTLLSKMFV